MQMLKAKGTKPAEKRLVIEEIKPVMKAGITKQA
jgi:hypothetical protein